MNPKLKHIVYLLIIMGLICSCQSEYQKELSDWKAHRLSEAKAPYGWASVVGLYEMRNSLAYFGHKDNNDFILPSTAPSSFGPLTKTDTGFYMYPYKNLYVEVNGEATERTRMLSDKEENGPTIASYKSLQWYFIERQDKAYLRVKDSLSIYRSKLSTIPYFDAHEKWRVKAIFTPATADSVVYQNELDMSFKDPIAGYLDFDIDGKSYRLSALANDEHSYFVIFADLTTGTTTYGGGRYLYPLKANAEGWTYLDFNKAENPPCVFTPYATCPLPPKENHLDIEIVAGEKILKLY